MFTGRRPSPARKWGALTVSGALIVALPLISGAEKKRVHDNGPSLVVTVTAPTSGATLSGVVKVEGSAAAKGGIARVEIGVDDGGFVKAQGTGSWTFMLDTTKFVEGVHQIVARATTKSGSVKTSSVDVRFADALPGTTSRPWAADHGPGTTSTRLPGVSSMRGAKRRTGVVSWGFDSSGCHQPGAEYPGVRSRWSPWNSPE